MGWASGSLLMTDIITAVSSIVDDDDTRKELYIQFIEAFEEYDCDTLDECIGEDDMFDSAYREIYADEVEEEDVLEDWDEE